MREIASRDIAIFIATSYICIYIMYIVCSLHGHTIVFKQSLERIYIIIYYRQIDDRIVKQMR